MKKFCPNKAGSRSAARSQSEAGHRSAGAHGRDGCRSHKHACKISSCLLIRSLKNESSPEWNILSPNRAVIHTAALTI